MTNRTIIAVVSDLANTGLTVEQQILVNELALAVADIQRAADERRLWREAKRVQRLSKDSLGAKENPPHPQKKTKNINITPNPPLDALFEQWWLVYPRREAKRAALKAYRHSVKRGATTEALLAGAKRYATLVADREKEYIKTPAAWLNADCHLDEGKVVSFRASPGTQRTYAEIKRDRAPNQG